MRRKERQIETEKFKETSFAVRAFFPPPGEGANPEPFLRIATDIVYRSFLDFEHGLQDKAK